MGWRWEARGEEEGAGGCCPKKETEVEAAKALTHVSIQMKIEKNQSGKHLCLGFELRMIDTEAGKTRLMNGGPYSRRSPQTLISWKADRYLTQ